MTIFHVIEHCPVDFTVEWTYLLPQWVMDRYTEWYQSRMVGVKSWLDYPSQEDAQAQLKFLLGQYDPDAPGSETFYKLK